MNERNDFSLPTLPGMPDDSFRKACAGYCQLAMKQVGVSQDARDCILDCLWECFDQISVDAARSDWEKK